MTTRVLVVVVLGLVLVTSGAATNNPSREVTRQGSGSCPKTIQAGGHEGIRTAAEIVAAVRRGVPRIFRDFTTQGGGPGWHHYQVEGLFSLNGGYYPQPRGIRGYLQIAIHRCGRAVAFGSWVVFLQFPAAPMASVSSAYIFVARTRRGWVAW